MTKREKDVKNRVWGQKYDTLCETLADLIFNYEMIKDKPDDEIIGETPLSKDFGGMRGATKVTAAQGRKMMLEEIEKKNAVKVVLERLLEL